MDNARIEADVIRLVEQLGPLGVPAGMTSAIAADLGFDSIRVLELICELEEHFNITVPLNELGDIRTVGEIVERVQVHVQAPC